MLATLKLDTSVRGLRLTRKGELAASGKGEITLLNPLTLKTARRWASPVKGQLIYLESLPDGTLVAPSIADGGVVWIKHARAPRFFFTRKGALNVRLGPDGKLYVANVDDDHVTVVSKAGMVIGQIGHGIKGPNGLAFGNCPAMSRAHLK
ncbi:hypothetical protein [Novosphingobium sp. Gsoil 351]|uniref:hypothetical protein n=1 Tax=Novosphingobium sp. Gsoil 351 TaxID=2675225 RepID=UPI0012B4AE5E|nr:hypothetical protein [Novosphingobium sp. Gsoil 351]QGN54121.1 hypothetical protein GKE62_05740 [Novosphingobium sp. Gsoil 351]